MNLFLLFLLICNFFAQSFYLCCSTEINVIRTHQKIKFDQMIKHFKNINRWYELDHKDTFISTYLDQKPGCFKNENNHLFFDVLSPFVLNEPKKKELVKEMLEERLHKTLNHQGGSNAEFLEKDISLASIIKEYDISLSFKHFCNFLKPNSTQNGLKKLIRESEKTRSNEDFFLFLIWSHQYLKTKDFLDIIHIGSLENNVKNFVLKNQNKEYTFPELGTRRGVIAKLLPYVYGKISLTNNVFYNISLLLYILPQELWKPGHFGYLNTDPERLFVNNPHFLKNEKFILWCIKVLPALEDLNSFLEADKKNGNIIKNYLLKNRLVEHQCFGGYDHYALKGNLPKFKRTAQEYLQKSLEEPQDYVIKCLESNQELIKNLLLEMENKNLNLMGIGENKEPNFTADTEDPLDLLCALRAINLPKCIFSLTDFMPIGDKKSHFAQLIFNSKDYFEIDEINSKFRFNLQCFDDTKNNEVYKKLISYLIITNLQVLLYNVEDMYRLVELLKNYDIDMLGESFRFLSYDHLIFLLKNYYLPQTSSGFFNFLIGQITRMRYSKEQLLEILSITNKNKEKTIKDFLGHFLLQARPKSNNFPDSLGNPLKNFTEFVEKREKDEERKQVLLDLLLPIEHIPIEHIAIPYIPIKDKTILEQDIKPSKKPEILPIYELERTNFEDVQSKSVRHKDYKIIEDDTSSASEYSIDLGEFNYNINNGEENIEIPSIEEIKDLIRYIDLEKMYKTNNTRNYNISKEPKYIIPFPNIIKSLMQHTWLDKNLTVPFIPIIKEAKNFTISMKEYPRTECVIEPSKTTSKEKIKIAILISLASISLIYLCVLLKNILTKAEKTTAPIF